MDRSARFLSLSGWSGVWAGCTALLGATIAWFWLPESLLRYNYMQLPVADYTAPFCFCGAAFYKPLILGIAIFLVALAGGYYFTQRKARRDGNRLWNHASRQMFFAIATPLIAGGIFCLGAMYYGHPIYVAPACLIFYGLALIAGSRHTVSDIRYLGYLELVLGAICLFMPGYGLAFWAAGFGLLHIIYGLIMWRRYDLPQANPHAA